MRRNPELEAALDELSKHGVTDVIRSGRKHIKLRFDHGGEPKLLVLGGTSSDWRAPRNVRADVRQILGVKRTIAKSSRPRKTRTKVAPAEIPTITCGRDPWAEYREDYEEARSCISQFGRDFGAEVAASCRRIRQAGRLAAQRVAGFAR